MEDQIKRAVSLIAASKKAIALTGAGISVESGIPPFRGKGGLQEKIDPLKAKISQLRDELSVYLDKLNDIQLEKDEKKIDEQHSMAKEKFEKTGKMSLQDLKLLMEKGDLKL